MRSTSRREFLKTSARLLPAALLVRGHGATAGQNAAEGIRRTPLTVDRYIDRLPIAKKLECVERRKDTESFHVRMVEFQKQLHSQLPPTKLWGYEGQYPGPTIEARQGRAVEVRWENRLPERHLFAVDQRIHGAMPPAPMVRAVPHLHGARTSSLSDGLPEKWFVPGSSVVYHYPNQQAAATLWYHDHALGITRLNVYAGLSGFYFLRDEKELSLSLPDGAYEVPLVLQDRTLDDESQLVYAPTEDDGAKVAEGAWGPQFFGNLPFVNGVIYPYLDVEPRPYRLRVLNASNGRFFNLYLNLARRPIDIPSLVSFLQIGSDGGLLAKAAKLQRVLLAPAERADLIVDFSGLDGKTVTLSNNAPAPYPGWNLLRPLHEPLDELMQFRVRLPRASEAKPVAMATSIEVPRMDAREAAVTREFVLSDSMDAQGKSFGMRINAKGYGDPVTEFPKLGSMEKWRFINMTDDAHPMHVHLVQFQILERQGFDFGAMLQGRLEFVGSVRRPALNEAGWKDTAVVNPHEVLTILVRFEGFTGRFVQHCHVAEHEDNDMMRPFEVVA
jgi:spore coat protein A, manganese oxidase